MDKNHKIVFKQETVLYRIIQMVILYIYFRNQFLRFFSITKIFNDMYDYMDSLIDKYKRNKKYLN